MRWILSVMAWGVVLSALHGWWAAALTYAALMAATVTVMEER